MKEKKKINNFGLTPWIIDVEASIQIFRAIHKYLRSEEYKNLYITSEGEHPQDIISMLRTIWDQLFEDYANDIYQDFD